MQTSTTPSGLHEPWHGTDRTMHSPTASPPAAQSLQPCQCYVIRIQNVLNGCHQDQDTNNAFRESCRLPPQIM